MQIAICEDNAAHLKRIVDLLHQHFDNILSYTVHTFYNGKSLLAFARNHQIDIIIMDIGLDGGSGIEIVKRLNTGDHRAEVIYVSSSASYFSDVYQTEHVYFLTKPLDPDVFFSALDRALDRKQRAYLCVNIKGGTLKRVCLSDVLYAEVYRHQTALHLADETVIECSTPLIELEKKLNGQYFLRCHRSFLVNLKAVDSIQKNELILTSGKIVPIGKKHSKQVREALLLLWGDIV